MFRVKPTIKQLKKYHSDSDSALQIPESWADFAPLLDIKSASTLIKFNPYPYQIILERLVNTYANCVIIKTRQLGVTEALLSIILHKALKNRAFGAAIFSLSDPDCKDNSTRSRLMLQGLNVETLNDNVHELALKTGGTILYKNSNPEGSRSRALSFLYFDEASHNKRLESIVAASTPSLTMTERPSKVFVSTPGLTDCYFFNQVLMSGNQNIDPLQLCKQVASGELSRECPGFYWWESDPDTCKIIIHWRAIPHFLALDETLKRDGEGGYLEYRKRKNNLTDVTLQRDHNLTFLSGEEQVFSLDLIENSLKGKWEETRLKGYRYIAGLDTNTTGKCFLVFTVIRESKSTGELSLVAMYRGRKKSQEYHLFEIGQLIDKFDIDKIAVETNSGGAFYWERITQLYPEKKVQGFDTTGFSKPLMIGRLLSAMERNLLEMPPENVIRTEFLNYSRVGQQFEAISGFADIVMSLAIGLQVSELSTIPEKVKSQNVFSEDFMDKLWGEK